MSYIGTFMTNAQGLTKNPLGIIGLFISLIYGFACLVLGFSISNLNSAFERLMLIVFIVVFPIIILSVFVYLVINHHEKLYSPSDFRNDNAFIETMHRNVIKKRKENEFEIMESANILEKVEEKVENAIPQGEVQVGSNDDRSVFLSRLEKAEKWGIKELELAYNVSFKVNQRFILNGMTLQLDAYARTKEKAIVAEVKYWESRKAIKPLLLNIQNFILRYDTLKRAFKNQDLEMVVVIVFDQLGGVKVKEIENFIFELNSSVSLYIKSFSILNEEYG